MSDVDAEVQVLEANGHFTKNMYNCLSKTPGNVFFSPISAHTVLSMAYQGSLGSTKDAFTKALKLSDPKSAAEGYEQVISKLNGVQDVTLLMANKVYIMEKYTLQEAFQNTVTKSFLSEVQSVNFAKSNEAAGTINGWVEDKTKNKIKDLISSDDLNGDTRLVLVNAIYFKGDWKDKFDPQLTTSEPFYVDDTDFVDVQMMHTKKKFNFKEDEALDAKVLEMPYKNKDISLIVVLPNKRNGISELEKKLEGMDLTRIADNMYKTEVEVSLPRFKIEQTLDLKETLNSMGLGVLFSQSEANLSGMIKESEQLFVSKVIQKAFIEVNEEGAEAAAATDDRGTFVQEIDPTPDNYTPIKQPIDVFEMDIKSRITNRFAKTVIMSKVQNYDIKAQETVFSVVLPEKAFITEFLMDVDDKIYKAYIKEKEEAKKTYEVAISSGRAAAHVAVSARDSNNFTVSLNVQPNTKATFTLTYEELLTRQLGKYEVVLNINPGQLVYNLNVEVHINESKPLTFVNTAPLRSGKEILDRENLQPITTIKMLDEKSAIVKFNPAVSKQKHYARCLENDLDKGFSGQFVVQYDVERDSHGGEILLKDGYFVHFFSPNDLPPLPKHVVFVLDTSGSMGGRKIEQLKNALHSILPQLEGDNLFSMIDFNSEVKVWDVSNYSSFNVRDINVPLLGFLANSENIQKAKKVVDNLGAGGGTDILTAIEAALNLISKELKNSDNKYQPMIIFLTDGEPTVGECNTNTIITKVTALNSTGQKTSLFTLSFGIGADKKFLRSLSLSNLGFSRHIYEAADAALQLEDFFKLISSPLLSNVTFKYDSEVREITSSCFPLHFCGSELVVAGIYEHPTQHNNVSCRVSGKGPLHIISLEPNISTTTEQLERLWAYLTVKQILEESNIADEKNKDVLLKKALKLALKYSFVTEVTSLVVVKPEENKEIPTRNSEVITENNEPMPNFAFCPPRDLAQAFAFSSNSTTNFGNCFGSAAPPPMRMMSLQSNCNFGGPQMQIPQLKQLKKKKNIFGTPMDVESLSKKQKQIHEKLVVDHTFMVVLKMHKKYLLFKAKNLTF